ncbi:MAG: dihydroorotate dehydrogenase, partial [Candidatus Brocadiaceae bacterium]|nr:dihydroorotate dehydrogenase [Candidatus Brocadiaceae bacterium]
MSVLIVGGDHLGSIPKELKKIGVDNIKHMSGRNRNVIKRGMPTTMDLIIVLHDYV